VNDKLKGFELLLSLASVLTLFGALLLFLGRKKNYAEPGEEL